MSDSVVYSLVDKIIAPSYSAFFVDEEYLFNVWYHLDMLPIAPGDKLRLHEAIKRRSVSAFGKWLNPRVSYTGKWHYDVYIGPYSKYTYDEYLVNDTFVDSLVRMIRYISSFVIYYVAELIGLIRKYFSRIIVCLVFTKLITVYMGRSRKFKYIDVDVEAILDAFPHDPRSVQAGDTLLYRIPGEDDEEEEDEDEPGEEEDRYELLDLRSADVPKDVGFKVFSNITSLTIPVTIHPADLRVSAVDDTSFDTRGNLITESGFLNNMRTLGRLIKFKIFRSPVEPMVLDVNIAVVAQGLQKIRVTLSDRDNFTQLCSWMRMSPNLQIPMGSIKATALIILMIHKRMSGTDEVHVDYGTFFGRQGSEEDPSTMSTSQDSPATRRIFSLFRLSVSAVLLGATGIIRLLSMLLGRLVL